MMGIFRRANHLLHFLSGGGSWRMNVLEAAMIDAAIGEMPASSADQTRNQLEQPFFVERMCEGRINVLRFYRLDEGLKIREAGFDDKLFRVSIAVDGAHETAHVTFYKGRLFSVEFKRPGRYYTGRKVAVQAVAVGSPDGTYTREIDEAEHGPDV